jgi:hypothetical protein
MRQVNAVIRRNKMPLANKEQRETMVAGYREMAENAETEREALDWCEALISDCSVTDDVEPEVRRDANQK